MKYRVWIADRKEEKTEKKDGTDNNNETTDNKENSSKADKENTDAKNHEMSAATKERAKIKLSEYEITGMKINGFSDKTSTTGVDAISSGVNNTLFENRGINYTVKRTPRYEVEITCKIRSNVDTNTYISTLTKFGQAIGVVPENLNEGSNYKNLSRTVKDGFKDMFKWRDAIEGAVKTTALLNKTNDLLKDFKISAEGSAENCVNIKTWFDEYKTSEREATDKADEENKDKKPEDTKVEATGFISKDVYKDIYIEVALSDIQSFYYHFNNMYIDSFTETYTSEEGTCTYKFKLCQHYSESELGNSYRVIKGKFTDKLSNGFKMLIDIINGGGKPVVTGSLLNGNNSNTGIGSTGDK